MIPEKTYMESGAKKQKTETGNGSQSPFSFSCCLCNICVDSVRKLSIIRGDVFIKKEKSMNTEIPSLVKKSTKKPPLRYTFDHLAIVLDENTYAALRKNLPIPHAHIAYETPYVGNVNDGMETFVLERDDVRIAFMVGRERGRGALSQITRYCIRYGNMKLQHIALRTNDIEQAVMEWEKAGHQFLTRTREGKPAILKSIDEWGVVYQSFTMPVASGLFFELKEVCKKEKRFANFQEFRSDNIEGLWGAVERELYEDSEKFWQYTLF